MTEQPTNHKFGCLVAAGLIVLCWLGWYLDNLAHQELTQAVRLIIGGGTITILFALIITLVVWGWLAVERVRMTRARRRILEREAEVQVVLAGEAVYARELNPRAIWRPLHLNPVQYQNGQQQEPTPVELAIYRLWHTTHVAQSIQETTPLLLETGSTIPHVLSILEATQRALIIGPSNTGKTNLLQWIVSRRDGSVVVIDPHTAPNKWPPSVCVVGIGSNHAEIETVLNKLIDLMISRYQEIGQGLVREGEHPKLTIVIDEWMSIAFQCKNAQSVLVRLLTESRKAAMSVIIGSHSERIRSLGLDGKGDLRDGFLMVRLWLENGERKGTYDYGRGERPCLLPGKYEQPQTSNVVEIEAITEVKPTEKEQQILDMNQAGASHAQICEAVWGYKSSKLYPQIETVLKKFNAVHRAQAEN